MTTSRRSGVQQSPRLNRMLRRADPEITEELKDAIGEMGMNLLSEAQARVPVDTGDLRNSISVRRGSNGLSIEVGFSPRRFRRAWRRGGWYARFIEYGTKGYQPERQTVAFREAGENAGERTTVMREANVYHRNGSRRIAKTLNRIPARPARPFLRPAFEAAKVEGLPRIRAALLKVLAKLSEGR